MKQSLKAVLSLLVWLMIVTVLSLMPDTGVHVELFPNQDKLVHFIFYLVMTFLLRGLYQMNQKRWHWKAILLASTYGFVLECIQGALIEGRHFDYLDIIANIIGSFIGSYLFYLLRKNDHNG